MATKIQLRRGNASAIPPLDVAEPGWDVDTKTLRVGDGTSSPARVLTTKSNGSFAFSSVTDIQVPRIVLSLGQVSAVSMYFHVSDPDTGFYSPGSHQIGIATGGTNRLLISDTGLAITGNVTVTGTVDSVDISSLNPSGVNGIMVKTGSNAYAFRNLVPGAGMGAMFNSTGQANAGGATGDIVIAIAPNATLPGKGGVKVPVGTTGERSEVAAQDGHFRYNSTTKAFEGRIDGEWRSIVDYVEGKSILVPSQMPSIQDAVNYYANRSARSVVYITLEAGTHTVSSVLSPGSVTTRIWVRGAAPINLNLHASTPVVSVSGSAGNWTIVYKLAGSLPTGANQITTDHSIVISNLYASGDLSLYSSDALNFAQIQSDKTKVKFNTGISNVASYYAVGDYIMLSGNSSSPEFRRITAINDASNITVDSAFATNDSASWKPHRKLRRITGTVYASGTTVTGVGTSFQTEVNVGDVFYLVGTKQYMKVTAIASNTSMTISQSVTTTANPGEIALQITDCAAHLGTWKVSSVDEIANTITVVNTSYSTTPPIKFGIRSGAITHCPSTVLFTNNQLMVLDSNEYMGISDVTMRYTGSTPTQNKYSIYAQNGATLAMSGVVGLTGGGVILARGATASANILAISSARDTAYYGLHIDNASYTAGNTIVTGCQLGVYLGRGTIASSTYAFVSNINSHGMYVVGGDFSAAYMRTSFNKYTGTAVYRGGICAANIFDTSSNGNYGLYLTQNSVAFTSWPNTMIFANGMSNIYASANSNAYMSQFVSGITNGAFNYGAIVDNGSALIGYGAIINNVEGIALLVSSNSHAYLYGKTQITGKTVGAQSQVDSMVILFDSVLKSLNSTGKDAYAVGSSSMFLVTCTGYLMNRCSPPPTGVPGNRNSIISPVI